MTKKLFIDFETRSEVDITKAGADVYARNESTKILCCAFAFEGEGPVLVFVPQDEEKRAMRLDAPHCDAIPVKAREHIRNGGTVIAHNLNFDWLIWNKIACKDYGWPPLYIENCEDSMALGCAMAYPASLDQLGVAMRVENRKDDGGSKLIRKMSKPPFQTGPELLGDMVEYCRADVACLREIYAKLKPLPDSERKIWLVNQRANQKGLHIDHKLIDHIMHLSAEEDKLLAEMAETKLGLTAPMLRSPLQFRKWCASKGVELPSLNKKDLASIDIENPEVLEALELREQVCKSSLKKFEAMRQMTCPDGRVRGNHFYHRATTGRFAGSGVQVQNIPRPEIDDPDSAADYILEHGALPSGLGVPTKTALSSLIRSCIVAPEFYEFFCADFASIESRVLFWLADEQAGLDVYRQGLDLYCETAKGIFGKDINKKDHPFERSIGKVAVLSCIAEGELVLTDVGEVPIEQVTPDMLVWDGVDFVKHDGIIYRGIKEVIEYEGLTATEDHIVWAEDGRTIPFGFCASQQIALAKTGFNGQEVRLGGNYITRDHMDRWAGQERAQESLPTCVREVLRVRGREAYYAKESIGWEDEGLPVLLATEETPKMVGSKTDRRQTSLREHQRQKLQKLRGQRDRVSLQLHNGGGAVVVGKHRCGQVEGVRPNKQQRPLRTREHTMGYTTGADKKHPLHKNTDGVGLPPCGVAVFREHNTALHTGGVEKERHSEESGESGSGKAERMATDSRKVRVYDILNCGPRNRFTVSNCLVHNCGYQGGVKAFTGFCDLMGLDLGELDPQTVVNGYRDTYPKVVQFWHDCEEGAMEALDNQGSTITVGKVAFKYSTKYEALGCRLPSGRWILWPEAYVDDNATTPWGAKTRMIKYKGVNLARKWSDKSTYSGDLAQSCTQAVARDILCDAMIRMSDDGFNVVLHVHDEIMVEEPENSKRFDEFMGIMKTPPTWAQDFPLDASGWRGKRYQK